MRYVNVHIYLFYFIPAEVFQRPGCDQPARHGYLRQEGPRPESRGLFLSLAGRAQYTPGKWIRMGGWMERLDMDVCVDGWVDGLVLYSFDCIFIYVWICKNSHEVMGSL